MSLYDPNRLRTIEPDGIELIDDERERQRRKGFTATHDDLHTAGELVAAAGLLLHDVTGAGGATAEALACAAHAREKWKGNPIRLLTIAGAFIAAELDRRIRADRRAEAERRRAADAAALDQAAAEDPRKVNQLPAGSTIDLTS